MIATFQNKVFQVSSNSIYTFEGLSWSGSLNTETQDKIGSKPSTYIKGENLMPLEFEIKLRADKNLDVRTEIEDWESIKSKANPSNFILGNKTIGKNKWLLKTVETSDMNIDNNGKILKATIKLSFEEFVRKGSASASTSNVAFDTSTFEPDQNIYDPDDKSSDTRQNPNKYQSIARGLYY